ncbi:unnamed protein product, partial [Rotaria magnacalcarata]
NIPANANWAQNGVTVAGGNGAGGATNQLNWPFVLFVDDKQTMVIVEYKNHRVMQWKNGDTTNGQVVAGGNGQGKGLNQLNAGGNGAGAGLNQLQYPTYLFVDRQQNVYVSEWQNHRVMKWNKCAKEGIVIAGGQGAGSALTQLNGPLGLFVDTLGTLYVVDEFNYRVMRWTQGATQGTVIVGGNGQGAGANQFYNPYGLSFDRYGVLSVVDAGNGRVQRFSIE